MKHTAILQEILEDNHALLSQSTGSRKKNVAPDFTQLVVLVSIHREVTVAGPL
jgi:hypothetical protein